ncbi:hypothetical protein VTH06DRAFT_8247 [Thermothelomyces fergusii]
MPRRNLEELPIPPMRQPRGPDPSGSAGFAARRELLQRNMPRYPSEPHRRRPPMSGTISSTPTSLSSRSTAPWGPSISSSNTAWSPPAAGRTSTRLSTLRDLGPFPQYRPVTVHMPPIPALGIAEGSQVFISVPAEVWLNSILGILIAASTT